MRSAPIIAALVGLALGLWLQAGHAAVYRWTDANGVVHFSQFPPQDRKSTRVSNAPISTVSGPSASSSQAAPADKGTNLRTAKPTAPTSPRAAPASPQACSTARSNLAVLKSGRRVKVQMPNGSTHWLTAAERSKRLKQTETFLTKRCK